ncbi:tetrahydrofolate synthase [Hanstruepera neustonica]|uniref:Dihydrofolate synthase/folylpolyglutamate synthase n=1 Tax=Hanstruepera neustonica TaxID=1445657 RepID=A0A2K1DZJ8_9FLAO|nr:folylpolyglutamate synthase/dihydrofolate synthase family protein [Hanstruepera neustonica]PNQ73457.1 tetrahydrofolate synthase [Hanstruepera neustonica]
MTYQDTLNWMFSKLPMYQRQGKSAYKADLKNSINLAAHLNNPQSRLKFIHVAGTNGKGSTSHMLASILQESGLKVGLFTSPHLKDFRERIKINGQMVSKQFVMGFIKRNQTFLNDNHLSFFEMTSGMAFDYFEKHQVDIAVIEVGLGGRLDSTNIITPQVSVITNIGFDHTQFLGDTLEKIAFEKAGIIKENIPIVIGESHNKTEDVFRHIAKEKNAPISFADKDNHGSYQTDLKGHYQLHNIKTVLETIEALKRIGYKINDEAIKKGLSHVVKNTGLQGRWQILGTNPKIICDTAHNKEGLELVMEQLKAESYHNLFMVFGVVNDKDIDSIIHLLPKDAYYLYCKPNVPRGMKVDTLKNKFDDFSFQGEACFSVSDALENAKIKATSEDLIYVGGSTFVVAEII